MSAATASTPKIPAMLSSFLHAEGLIFKRRKDIRWQNTAMKAKKITEYSQIEETTRVHITTITTMTIRIIDHQLACFDLTRLISAEFRVQSLELRVESAEFRVEKGD